MENIINFEELREGLEPNQEYIERIAKVAGNSEDIVADVTYEMFENLQNTALGALLQGDKRLFVEIAILNEDSEATLRYLMEDEAQCADAGLIMTMRSILEFAPFNVAFKKMSKQDIIISQMTDVLNKQKSLYVVKENFQEVVVDMFDYAKSLLDETLLEDEAETAKYSEKTDLNGKAVKKKEYVDHYTSCYNFSKDEIKDMMYN